MKKKIFTLLLSLMLVSSTCSEKDENKHNVISVKNNNDMDIYVYGDFFYPDTSINFSNPSEAGNYYKVTARSEGDPLQIKDTYEGRFKQYEKLMVFIFDAHTIETTSWDTIKAKYLVLKRYDLRLEDLQKSNWTVTYP
jgi:hypothetical protein